MTRVISGNNSSSRSNDNYIHVSVLSKLLQKIATAQPEDFPHLSSDRTFQLKGGTSSLESQCTQKLLQLVSFEAT